MIRALHLVHQLLKDDEEMSREEPELMGQIEEAAIRAGECVWRRGLLTKASLQSASCRFISDKTCLCLWQPEVA